MHRFAHIVNPFSAKPGSHHAIAQPVSFASMLRAAKEAEGIAAVELFTTQFPEDRTILPAGFTATRDLDRSVCDVAQVAGKRKLPLLGDILGRLHEASDADYFIYTNADIALMPGFYKMCAHFADKGYDAFVINRRRIPARFDSPAQLEEMYAEAGETHTGYDTLVFRRSLFEKFTLGNVVIGIPYGDTVLIHNLYAFAENFRLFTGKHLTFHLGMELTREWGEADQYRHNRKELKRILRILYPHFRIANFPGASLPFFKRHFKWLMNPTFDYPTMLKLDLAQLSSPRRAYPHDGNDGQRYLNYMIRKVNFPDEE